MWGDRVGKENKGGEKEKRKERLSVEDKNNTAKDEKVGVCDVVSTESEMEQNNKMERWGVR